jgi:hypothetical protein
MEATTYLASPMMQAARRHFYPVQTVPIIKVKRSIL